MVQTSAGTKNITSYRVIYGDTDQMGIVYYANYLRWFERGRSEFLRQIGLPYTQIEGRGYYFPVTEVSCRYFKSARYDDLITIATQLKSFGRATLHFEYRISIESETSFLALGWTRHACVNTDGRITRIPGAFAHLLAQALPIPR
ncbi:MAG TPA: thioesterase family protein [Candidatus Binatia bacterium]|jgi:acyl-CoA thioester hydrolase